MRVARCASGRKRLTQGRRVQREGGISICPRLKWTVTFMTRGCCPADHQTQLGRPNAVRGTSLLEEQVFLCESSTLGWMILFRTQYLLPLCLRSLRVCWMHWFKICTRFHEVFGVDGSDHIGELHRCAIEKHAGLSNWCAIWLRGLVQFRSVWKFPERCGSITVERPVDVGSCNRRYHSRDGVAGATTIPIEVPLESHEGGILPSETVRVGWSSLRSDARLGNSRS